MDALQLLGYFSKKVEWRPDWLKAPQVVAIRSASTCVSGGPKDWIDLWKHNEVGLYGSESRAKAVIPETKKGHFELHAYRVLPILFDHGRQLALELPAIHVEPLSNEYRSIGYDAVSRDPTASFDFGCSPLSCNHMAEEISTNEHCLLPTLHEAEAVALRFSLEEPEPGPYWVVEVLARLRETSKSDRSPPRRDSVRRD